MQFVNNNEMFLAVSSLLVRLVNFETKYAICKSSISNPGYTDTGYASYK